MDITVGDFSSYSSRLRDIGITIEHAPLPLANYLPSRRAGNLVYISGTLPVKGGCPLYQGLLGRDITVEQGYEAAKLAVINSLAIVDQVCTVGNIISSGIDNIGRIIKLTGYVASVEGFYDQPAVVNGASDLLVEIFGENGRHARAAVGVCALPLNVPVEIELVVEVKS